MKGHPSSKRNKIKTCYKWTSFFMFTILFLLSMERRIDLKETPGYYKTSKSRKQSTIENILALMNGKMTILGDL